MGYKYQKETILNVGYDVFRRNGYHNVGINEILKACGIPKGSFYNFFESKEDYAQQVIRHYGETNASWIQTFFEKSELAPIDALESFYSFMIEANQKDEYAGGCLINNMSMEVGRHSDDLAAESDTHFTAWTRVLAQTIKAGQKQKSISKKCTAEELAEYLHAGFYGALSRSKITRNREYLDNWLKLSMNFIRA